ncbi:MAG TPA: hypothetical protein VLA56_02365 [Pseudomonadales bacterium]|nr:hypothetical protein [Pseudomonadales bacterium]
MRLAGIALCCLSLALAAPFAGAQPAHGGGQLPPGLQKKVERGGELPPGWQKKLNPGDVLDDDIYDRGRVVVPLGGDGAVTVDIDGTLLRLHQRTRRIIAILGE